MCQIQPTSHLGQGYFAFNVRQPGHVPVQHVWKPLGFVGQLIETLIGEAMLVWFLYFQPSRIYFHACLSVLTSLSAVLPHDIPPSLKER